MKKAEKPSSGADGHHVSSEGYAVGGDICGGYQLDSRPLRHPPGSEGRILELQRRASMHLSLFGHPADADVEVA